VTWPNTATATTALNELKALLSKGYLVREVLEIDKNTSERSVKKFLFVQQQSHVACMNKDEAALHGSIKLRHLLNMSSGAEVEHARDPGRIDVPGLLGFPAARATGPLRARVGLGRRT
jgi:hypothetical protein